MIRDFTLPDLFGNQVRISDFRGKTNLVLFFLGNSPTNSLAWSLANKRSDFAEQQATLVAILSRAPDAQESGKLSSGLPVVLRDEEACIHRLFGAIDECGAPATVVYITDRFGEIASVHPEVSGKQLPPVEDVLKTLEFINHRCPECEPPEWPR